MTSSNFPKQKRPSGIHVGDRMILYACGGSRHIFADAQVTSEVYRATWPPTERCVKNGRHASPHRMDIACTINLPCPPACTSTRSAPRSGICSEPSIEGPISACDRRSMPERRTYSVRQQNLTRGGSLPEAPNKPLIGRLARRRAPRPVTANVRPTEQEGKIKMGTQKTRVNPSEETIKIGPIETRFLLTGHDSNGSASVFEVLVPAGQKLPAPAHKNDAYEEVLYGVRAS